MYSVTMFPPTSSRYCIQIMESWFIAYCDVPGSPGLRSWSVFFQFLVVYHSGLEDPWPMSRRCLEPRWFVGYPTSLACESIIGDWLGVVMEKTVNHLKCYDICYSSLHCGNSVAHWPPKKKGMKIKREKEYHWEHNLIRNRQEDCLYVQDKILYISSWLHQCTVLSRQQYLCQTIMQTVMYCWPHWSFL